MKLSITGFVLLAVLATACGGIDGHDEAGAAGARDGGASTAGGRASGGTGGAADARGGSTSGTAGTAYTAGYNAGGDCYQGPMAHNDPECPDPYGVSSEQWASPCLGELMCDFRVPTGVNYCTQPPHLIGFRCCGWGFVRADLPCPSLAPDSDPRCAFPIEAGEPCEDLDLSCAVQASDDTQTLTCCASRWQMGPCQLK